MALADIVNVTITAQTQTPTKVGFGIPLVMGYHTKFPERARSYTSMAGLTSDGFSSTSAIYKAANALFSQNPRPVRVVVGREGYTQKKKIRLTPVAVNDTVYTVYVNDVAASYTSDSSATIAEITAGLKVSIDALSAGVTTTDNSTSLDVEETVLGTYFTLSVANSSLISLEDTTVNFPGAGIVEDVAAVQQEDDDWYTCILTSGSGSVISAAATSFESKPKLLMAFTADTGVKSSVVITDIATSLKNSGFARTVLIYHPKGDSQFPNAAWAGVCLPKDPGSITWKFKTLRGVDYTSLTSTEENALKNKNCNMYVSIAGLSMTQEGLTPAGEFVDVTRSIDFLSARLQEYVFGTLKRADKIPYTNAGVAAIEADVRAVMQLGIKQGIITDDPENVPVVIVPKVSEVSVNDRAARLLPDVTFSAILAGAIHSVEISGTISV